MLKAQITGVKETQIAIETFMGALEIALPQTLEQFGKEVTEEAKRICPVDTGALKDSIHHKLTKNEPLNVEEQIIAGDVGVVRGTSPWTFSRRTQKEVKDKTPTSEYAEIVDSRGNKSGEGKGYMTNAYNWAKSKIGSRITAMIETIARIF